jgi:predicted small lipoprotein YifL
MSAPKKQDFVFSSILHTSRDWPFKMRYPVLVVLLMLLAACGQKGPLYLPKDEPGIAVEGNANESEADESNAGEIEAGRIEVESGK